jgi:hypothetical protein
MVKFIIVLSNYSVNKNKLPDSQDLWISSLLSEDYV